MWRHDIASGGGGSVLSEDALRRALATAGLAAPVRWDETTESTNATALAMAADGTPAWTLIAAGHQTAGRGRLGRVWVDRPGQALMCSVVLRPAWDPERLGLVSLAAGVAMARAASEASGLDVRCKWPNDLIVADTKVGGILAESEVAQGRVRHVVVGAGVNLETPDDVPGAGAIGDVEREQVLAAYLSALRGLMDDRTEEIIERWRAVSHTLGRTIQGTTVDGGPVRGVAVDLDETGALLVETDAGRLRVAFGEVQHLGVNQG
jgi:BirA family transcriptional regulator, biotin operon repressor / biotin---[acetyl-CoA-carboxylase] ligase